MRMITSFVLAVILSSSAALAQAGLKYEDDINEGLFVVAVGSKINRACDTIGVRFLAANSYVNNLKSMARDRGYSNAEIRAYINDKAGKAEMKKRRNAYYKSKGASNLDHESLCVLGHEEIRKKSQIGVLLKAK